MKKTTERPLIFGYHSAREGTPTAKVMEDRSLLTTFALNEGMALAGIYTETAAEPSVALQAMIDSAARRDVAAVAVPGMIHLGTEEDIQSVTRTRLETAGIRVLMLIGGAPS